MMKLSKKEPPDQARDVMTKKAAPMAAPIPRRVVKPRRDIYKMLEAVAATPVIEVVSVPSILVRPRYMDGLPLASRLHWSRPDNVAMKALTEAAADLERSARGLGRTEKNLVNRARDTGLKLPEEWLECLYPGRLERQAARQRQRDAREKELSRRKIANAPMINIAYPYIRSARGEHADLIAINALVPRGVPDHCRADICQELMLEVLEGKTTVAALQKDKSLLHKYLKYYQHEHSMITSYAIALDRPMSNGGNWYDVLPAPVIDDDDAPLHSFEELAAAFPSVVRMNGGRQTDAHLKSRPRPDKCQHGLWRWETCARCEQHYKKSLIARDESGRHYD